MLEGERGGSRVQGGKHLAPEHDTPGPRYRRPAKRFKLASGSNAQATSQMVKWALVPASYPDHKMTPEDVRELKRLLRSQILSLMEGTKAPTFEGL